MATGRSIHRIYPLLLVLGVTLLGLSTLDAFTLTAYKLADAFTR